MPLFCKKKKIGVQSFMLKVINNHCSDLEALGEGPRLENRVRLSIVVMIVPVENGRPLIEQTFAAVTKEFSTGGLALILSEPKPLDEVILGFRWERAMSFVSGKAMHLSPMGAGFYQLGVELTETVNPGDYPGLNTVIF